MNSDAKPGIRYYIKGGFLMTTTTNALLIVLLGVIAFFTTFLSEADIISF